MNGSDFAADKAYWWDEIHTARPITGRSYAQTDEDHALAWIFENIETTNQYLVDLGAGDGYNLSNTRHFLDHGWQGLLIDGSGPHDGVLQEWIDADTIASVLTARGVPRDLDLLSIDLDGQDWWVWDALLADGYTARVVIVEFNTSLTGSVTVPKQRDFAHDRTTYFGASFEAFRSLGEDHGYTLVANFWRRNLIFIQRDIIPGIQPRVVHNRHNYFPPCSADKEWVTV